MTKQRERGRSRLKRAVARNAPKIAEAIGGPLAGSAIEALSRAIFGDEAVDENQLSEAVENATPAQLLAIREAELAFRAELARIALDGKRIDAADRANARERQKAMGDWTSSVLGALIIGGFFIVLAAMIWRKLPANAETEFSIKLGALATMTAAVVNYFFGSSAGSREKTRLLSGVGGVSDQDQAGK